MNVYLFLVLSVLPELLQRDYLHHSQQCGLMLMLPLLQILSDNETKHPKLKSLASNVFINIENLASMKILKVQIDDFFEKDFIPLFIILIF